MRREPDLSDGEYRALAQFRASLRSFVHFSESAAKAAGITPAQHQLLLAVRGHAGPTPPSTTELADVLRLRLHSTVELAARADANGLVVREPDPDDHRRMLIRLTPRGARVLARLSVLHRSELQRFHAQLGDLLRPLDGPPDPW